MTEEMDTARPADDASSSTDGQAPIAAAEYQAAVESLPELVVFVTPLREATGRVTDFRYDYLNRAARAALLRPGERQPAETMVQRYPGLVGTPLFAALQRAAARSEPFDQTDFRYPGATADELPPVVRLSAYPVGERLAVVWREVTQRHYADELIRRSEERLRTSLDSSLDCYAIFTTVRDAQGAVVDFRYEYLNPAGAENNGCRAEEAVGRTMLEVMPGHRGTALFEAYRQVVETGEPLSTLVLHEDEYRGGARINGAFDIRAAKLGDGLVITWRNVTEQQRQERALRESEERFRAALDTMLDCFALLEPIRDEQDRVVDLRYRFINRAGAEHNGRPAEQTVGHTLLEVLPILRGSELFEGYRRVAETGEPFSRVAMVLDAPVTGGRRVTGAIDIRAARYSDGVAIAWRDVTDRVRAEEALRESEELLRGAFAHASVGMALVDLEGRWARVNPALLALLGCEAEELLGRAMAEVLHPDDRAAEEERAQALLCGEMPSYQAEVRCVDQAGQPRWVLLNSALARDSHGQPWLRVVQLLDVTVRKQAQEELVRSHAELQQFAYVASHDLQEPLRKIRAFGDRLTVVSGEQLDDRGRDYLRRMQSAAGRMTELIDALLAYSRVATRPVELRWVQVAETVAEALQDLELRLHEAGAEVTVDAAVTVQSDPVRLREVFQNVLANALKFGSRERPLRVAVRAHTQGGEAVIRVEDNGIGFEPEFAQRIFEPFQRLHGRDEYPGTGMGLAIVDRVLRRLGGTVSAEGRPGQGATFELRLPLADASDPGGEDPSIEG